MSGAAAELIVEVVGRDVGASKILRDVAQQLVATENASRRARAEQDALATDARKAADAELRLATSFARVDAATDNYAGALARLRSALAENAAAGETVSNSVKVQIANYEKAAAAAANIKPPTNIGSEFAAGIKHGLIGIVGPAALASAALAGVVSVAASFKSGLELKASLDATSASLKIQLNGVRDVNQVYAEGQAFATKYKLTQEELSGSIAASTAIMRSSKASTTDILNVLSELTVLAPGKSIQDAAFSVRELASGDIVSIADQFNISKVEAYKMRDAIAGGADAVTVLQGYLTSVGVNMDAVESKATGLQGALKDVKIAQEEVSLAQGELAAAGLPAIETTATALRGLAGILKGDVSGGFESVAQKVLALAGIQIAPDSEGLQTFGDVASAVFLAAADGAISAAEAQKIAALATNELSDAGTRSGAAWAEQAAGATTSATATADAAAQDLIAKANADVLAGAKAQLAEQAQLAANAIVTAGGASAATAARLAASSSLVDQLTAAYLRLALAQNVAGVAGAGRLAAGRQQTRDLTQGKGVGANAPGRRGASDADITRIAEQQAQTQDLAKAQRSYNEAVGGASTKIANLKKDLAGATTETERLRIKTELVGAERSAAKGGRGGGRAKQSDAEKNAKKELRDAERLEDQKTKIIKDAARDREQIERDYQDSVAKIAEDGAKARQGAEKSYQLSQRRDRVSFYKSLADIEDPTLRADAAAEFEAIATKSAEIAKTQGADAAAAYREASISALQAQTDIKQQIAQAEKDGDKGKAENLRGILKLQEDADAEELAQVAAQGSAIASAEASRYREAEARYREHLDEKARILAEKAAELGVDPADLGGTGQAAPRPPRSAAPPITPAQAQPGTNGTSATSAAAAAANADGTTPAAAASDLGALLSAANDLASKANDLLGRIAGGTDKLKAGRPLTGEGV